ncbi:MAG: ankyrin repeat domain-containing protein [Bacteroidales bacterium]
MYDNFISLIQNGQTREFIELAKTQEANFLNSEKDENGWILLHHAAEHGAIDIMKFLIEVGCDVNAKSDTGYTPLYIAIETGAFSTDMARLLINHGAEVGSSLHKAVLLNNIQLVKEALPVTSDINKKDKFGNTALHHAIAIQNAEIVDLLLTNQADIDCYDNYLTTPLHAVCADNATSLISLVLKAQPDLEAEDYNGRTAIIFAAGNAFKEGVKLLLERQVKIDHQDNFGNTALHYAFENSETEIAQLLIQAGADTKLRNEDGSEPFDLFPA